MVCAAVSDRVDVISLSLFDFLRLNPKLELELPVVVPVPELDSDVCASTVVLLRRACIVGTLCAVDDAATEPLIFQLYVILADRFFFDEPVMSVIDGPTNSLLMCAPSVNVEALILLQLFIIKMGTGVRCWKHSADSPS
jgi:hypothetical protein